MKTDRSQKVSGNQALVAIAVLIGMAPLLVACVYVPIGTMLSWSPHYEVLSAITTWTMPWSGVAEDLLGYQLELDSTDPRLFLRCWPWLLSSLVNCVFWLGIAFLLRFVRNSLARRL